MSSSTGGRSRTGAQRSRRGSGAPAYDADAEEVLKTLKSHGVTQSLSKRAVDAARQHSRFTIFAFVGVRYCLMGKNRYTRSSGSRHQRRTSPRPDCA